MRSLRVSHSAVVDEWRGRERALTSLGVDVTLLCAEQWHAGGSSVTLEPRDGERVVGVRTFGHHPALFLYDPRPIWRALGERYDVIDVHEEPFALATAEILLLRALRKHPRRTPVVLYTAQNLRKRYPVPFRWFERWALRAASGISACNAEAARIVEDKGFAGRARVIPLGIDEQRFRPADASAASAPPRDLGPASIVVGFLGRLVPEKGVLVLLDAVARDPRLRLRIAGSGPLAPELGGRATAVGIADRVEVVGPIDPDAVVDFYRTLDVLAVPSLPTTSWTEQFGRVAVEAMACGVPVVSSDAGALPDVVGRAGLVVPAGDAAALASALVEAGRERADELRARGLERAAICTWDAVGRQYLDLYRAVLHEASTAAPDTPDPARPVEVIVVAYGAPELLRRAVEPVAALPVTVVDNSSLPEIAAICAELGVRYLDPGRNGGFAAGVNVGLRDRLVPGADVLLLNPDATISPEDIAVLRRVLRAHDDLASVGPAQVDEHGHVARVAWWLPSPGGTWFEALGLARLRRDPSYVIGSVLLLRAEALDQVGAFDERFFLYAEEADWAYRAHRLGWRHAGVPEARATHVGAGTGGDPRRREAHFHASQERYLRKHYGAIGWQWARLGQLVGATARAIVLPGDRGRSARRRAALYRLGPVRVEARFRREAAASGRDAAIRRVALVASSYAPHFGGVEEHVRQVAHELSQRGDTEIEVWTVDRGEHLGVRDVDGVVVRYLPTPLPARNLRSMLALVRDVPQALIAWSRARRSFRPQLLHVHCFGPNGVYALVLGRLWRLPIAVTSHGETSADDHGAFARSALLRRTLRTALGRARFVTAPSEWVLNELRTSFGLRDGGVVPNGVVTDVGCPDSVVGRLPALDDPAPFFAAVGRLGPLKGFDLLLDAFASAGLPEDTRLLIGGDGPERSAIERRIVDLGLTGRAELLGRLDAGEVARVMERSIAVAVPSRLEPFGIVALEAWRAAAALIMTDRGGGPEFVRDGIDGLLVDPVDRDALATALRRVHDDLDLRVRLAHGGRARVSEFSWSRVAAAYRARYGLG
ncbi:glycosyltransferase [Agromyces sp. H66]|uniref:glycosyltransferase n=1 Tax=Agromyces sp. H66 TaxID=2529859 RepID=UPI0010A9FA4B|nr:glycosyltransferase [Agromyces sp. H66]